ncbi:Tetratricopeptide repeat protein 28 [Dissostichus eleginoides]|uniref:Tetratricopeptide repeat protein 28 n=1 Tax=Dissostichus eleginoides TaxID=100907 RepID=A0AAD9BYS8_DISEL|nr:Tetratricopeptide repeat protein 28 [Dissostichus eleginoides]
MEQQATLKEKFSIFGSRTAGRPIRCVSGDDGARCGLSKAEFMEKVQQSNEACQRGDFQAAIHLYTNALQADPQNCILFSNRSAARLKLGHHQAALEDAEKACELNPKWPKSICYAWMFDEGTGIKSQECAGIQILCEYIISSIIPGYDRTSGLAPSNRDRRGFAAPSTSEQPTLLKPTAACEGAPCLICQLCLLGSFCCQPRIVPAPPTWELGKARVPRPGCLQN